MGIFDKYNGLGSGLPVRAVKGLVVYGARPVWDRVMGASLDEPEIRRRTAEMPLHKAELGAVAIGKGIRDGDEELRHLGEAMVVRALTDAEEQRNDVVVQAAVTDMAASLPLEDVRQNPYISPSAADRVTTMLGMPATGGALRIDTP